MMKIPAIAALFFAVITQVFGVPSPADTQFESLSAKALEILGFDAQAVSISAPPWPANVTWIQNQKDGVRELTKRVDFYRKHVGKRAFIECSIVLNSDSTILLLSKVVDDELLTYSVVFFYDGDMALSRVGTVRSNDVKPRVR